MAPWLVLDHILVAFYHQQKNIWKASGISLNLEIPLEIIYMNRESSTAIYFISVASTLSGIHQQTIRSYEEKGLIKPYRTGGGTRRYSQSDIDKLIQIQDLSQRGINLDGIKIIYEMRDKIEELQETIVLLQDELSQEKIQYSRNEKDIHQSYKNEIVKKTDKSIKKNI